MAPVFKTPKDSPDRVQTPAGTAEAYGKGGLNVADAAAFIPELQKQGDDGYPVLDDDTGQPVPLEGKELTAAAKAYAEARGLEVVNVKEDQATTAALMADAGYPPERPPAQQVAEQEYQDNYAHLEPVNTIEDHETAAEQGSTAMVGEPAPAEPTNEGEGA